MGVGRPGGFVLGGGSHPDSGVWPGGVEPVDPLGGGDLDGVDVLPRALVADQLSLVQRVERLGQSLPIANGPVLHPTVASGAPGPSGQHRLVSAARRPSEGRSGPGRYTLAGRWSASPRFAARRHW